MSATPSTFVVRAVACTVAAFVVMAFPPTAEAGTYDVLACGGGPNLTWHREVNHGGMAAYPDAPACGGDGLVARHVGQPQGWTVPTGSAARWWFDAPPGAAVVGVAMKARFDTYDHRWQSVLSNGQAVLRGCLPGDDSCGVDLDGSYFDIPPSQHVYTEAYCPAGPCPAYWQPNGYFGNVFAEAIIYAATMRIADYWVPNLVDPRGPAWTDAWLGGSHDVVVDAGDNSGIAKVTASLDSDQAASVSRGCDAFAMTCPDWPGATLLVNTRAVSDGTHRLTLTAVDRSGNPNQISRDIQVDNTPPSAPETLAADGNGAWSSKAEVRLTWSNPQQQYAPITGAVFEACPAGKRDGCVQGDRAGTNISSLTFDVTEPGRWDIRVWLRDAAGNASRENTGSAVSAGFDPDPPEAVVFEPVDPEDPARVRVRATDALSGVAGGEIDLRREGEDTWRSLPAELEDRGFRAMLPDGDLADGAYELRARAWDAAGNERSTTRRIDGSTARLTLPVRIKTHLRVGQAKRVRARTAGGHRRLRTIYVRRPILRHGRRARLGGRLVAPGGNPLAGVPVDVTARLDVPGSSFAPVATLTTRPSGRFSYLLPAGPSRIVRFSYAGGPKIRPQVREVQLRIRAFSSMHANRRHIVTGEPVTFGGRIRTLPMPASGKLVELQYRDRGRWRTFRTMHAAASSGRWSYTYPFTGTSGRRTYQFRVRVPRENGYPYAPGASRSVRVTVRGL